MVSRVLFFTTLALALNCLNNNGSAVSWYTALKLTQYANGPFGGKTFAVISRQYFDANNLKSELQTRALNDTTFMTYTLNQLNQAGVSYVLYKYIPHSDEAPGESTYNYTYGHSKGILAYTSSAAILLVHSIPGFPIVSNGKVVLDIPSTGVMYGQSFMCVELQPQQLFAVAGMMKINYPNVYASQVLASNANITALVNKSWTKGKTLTTYLGNGFTYMCKSGAANIELWEDLVCPHYSEGFEVQSWGRPYMASYCTPDHDYDAINVSYEKVGSTSWEGYDDHSKWGVSLSGYVTCVGDINRMTSQASRGGGVLCFDNESLHTVFKGIVTGTQSCSSIA